MSVFLLILAVPFLLIGGLSAAIGVSFLFDGDTASGIFYLLIGLALLVLGGNFLRIRSNRKKRKAAAEQPASVEAAPARSAESAPAEPVAVAPVEEAAPVFRPTFTVSFSCSGSKWDSDETPGATLLGISAKEEWRIVRVKDYCVVDTETTGLSSAHDRICEIAVLRIVGGEIVDEVSTLVNPEQHISAAATAVNGITDQMVADAPTYEQIRPRVAEILLDLPVVGHNTKFDLNFIVDLLGPLGEGMEISYFDTLHIARRLWPALPDHKLQTLIDEFGIDPGQAHRARDDARATWELFLRCRDELLRRKAEKAAAEKAEKARKEKERREKCGASPLYNKAFVFTGDFDAGRGEVEQMAEEVGAIVRGSVSKKTDFLVVGDLSEHGGQTAKKETADQLIADGEKLRELTEADFLRMIAEAKEALARG